MLTFTKMQGAGNDYVYINNDVEKIEDMSGITKIISNRNFGVGSDGCIFIYKDKEADIAFRIFNVDGSEANMCGNGIRCVAKYVYEKNIVKNKRMKIKTNSGIKDVEVYVEDDEVKKVKVNMGTPIFCTKKIGVDFEKEVLVNEKIRVIDKDMYITSLSVGNLHTVIFVDNVDKVDIEKYGPIIENMKIFKDRTNVEFVEVVDKENIKIRVWERGVGETLACGTGATASVIAGYINGFTDNICNVKLKGGILEIIYNESLNEVEMIGDAKFVYEGKMYIDKM